jgi:hypothetical protein
MDAQAVLQNVREVAGGFAKDRKERQRRRHLDPADFTSLKGAGSLLTGVPAARGGLWKSAAESTRPICEILRPLAAGDASVALVCSMHPVLAFWLAKPTVDADGQKAWDEQRALVAETALAGEWCPTEKQKQWYPRDTILQEIHSSCTLPSSGLGQSRATATTLWPYLNHSSASSVAPMKNFQCNTLFVSSSTNRETSHARSERSSTQASSWSSILNQRRSAGCTVTV